MYKVKNSVKTRKTALMQDTRALVNIYMSQLFSSQYNGNGCCGTDLCPDHFPRLVINMCVYLA